MKPDKCELIILGVLLVTVTLVCWLLVGLPFISSVFVSILVTVFAMSALPIISLFVN